MALAGHRGLRMRINNPVIRAGSVIPSAIALPQLRFDQPTNITIPGTSWGVLFTQDLTDQPLFGPSFAGHYQLESQIVIIGGAADATVTRRIGVVTGASTGFYTYEQWTVKAGQTTYHHSFTNVAQPDALVWDITYYTEQTASDLTLVGKTGALDDWTWQVITKVDGVVPVTAS